MRTCVEQLVGEFIPVMSIPCSVQNPAPNEVVSGTRAVPLIGTKTTAWLLLPWTPKPDVEHLVGMAGGRSSSACRGAAAMAQRVETNEGEEGMISSCSRAGSSATNDLVMVATEALVVSCHSCSLTPSRRAHEASNACT